MDYLKSNYEASSGFGSLQPHTTDFTQHSYPLFCEYTHSPAFHLPPPGVLPVQYAPSPYNPPGIVTAQANFHLPPAILDPLMINDGPLPTGIPSDRPQHGYPSYPTMNPIYSRSIEGNGGPEAQLQSQIFQTPTPQTYPPYTATRTTHPAPISGHEIAEGRTRAHSRRPTRTRDLVSQKLYKSCTRQTKFSSSEAIEFIVNDRAGIRLSDALEGNGEGLMGRDDRSLFKGNRSQIIIRLQFEGCLPWHSKVHTRDFTAQRREIARMKLAKEVAKSVDKFIAREKLGLSLENVFLTRMVQVSVASWQPELFVEHSSVSSRAASSSPSPNRVTCWEARSRALS